MGRHEIVDTYKNMHGNDLIQFASINRVKYFKCSKVEIVKNLISSKVIDWSKEWEDVTTEELKKTKSAKKAITETNEIPTFRCDYEGFDETLQIKSKKNEKIDKIKKIIIQKWKN